MRLALLDFGRIETSYPDGRATVVPVPGALIQLDDGAYVLVDTGMPGRYVDNAEVIPAKEPRVMRARMAARHTARAQLGLFGLRPSDIQYVVATHFDWDHCGANAEFPQATFYVQREHLAAARHDPTRFWPELWDLPGLRYEALDGDAEPLLGLRLLETSGHVAGHQSVVVELPETGAVVLAIDAIKDRQQVATAHWEGPDVARSRSSGERLLTLVGPDAKRGLLVYGHDPEQWPTLRPAPQWYT